MYPSRDYPYGYVGQYGYDKGFDYFGTDHFYSGPLYEARPYLPKKEERNIDEKRNKGDHVDTNDDAWSSSDSDSLSSSDYFEAGTDDTKSCASQGDPYACLRVEDIWACNPFETFNRDMCLCVVKEEFQCNALKPDGYTNKNGCPDDKPIISPIDNCKCISYAEQRAMRNHNLGYHCKDSDSTSDPLVSTSESSSHSEVEVHMLKKPLVICNSDTDSDSDCVRIGGPNRRIGRGSQDGDDNGNLDSSIYEDTDCDPRYSSCDTNSNKDFSNTDSNSVLTVDPSVQEYYDMNRTAREYLPLELLPTFNKKLDEDGNVIRKHKKDDIRGSLAFHYANKYGVYVPSDTEEEPHDHHGYWAYKEDCGDRSCNTDDVTYRDFTGDLTYNTYDFTSKSSTAGFGDPRIDSCDSSDIDCPKKPVVESDRDYFSSETTEEVEQGPSTGTSNSSNSTGEHNSDSASGHDSSSAESTDTEADSSALSEDLCAHAIMLPDHGAKTTGWVEFYAPALGHFAESVRIEGNWWDLENDPSDTSGGMHGFHVHVFGDLSRGCDSTGPHYLPANMEGVVVRSSDRGLASYYDWNDLM